MAFKKIRNMKVYAQSGYNYKSTPIIMLKGNWLEELGFGCGGGQRRDDGSGNHADVH